MNILRRFLCGEDAATAVEYAVMLALILVAVLTAVESLGSAVFASFTTADTEMIAHGM